MDKYKQEQETRWSIAVDKQIGADSVRLCLLATTYSRSWSTKENTASQNSATMNQL